MHRILAGKVSPNAVVQAIHDNILDDFLSTVPEAYRSIINEYKENIYLYIRLMKQTVNFYYQKMEKSGLESKKEKMIWIQNNIPKDFQGAVRNKVLGYDNDYLKHINDTVKYQFIINKLKKLKEANK